MVSYRPVKETPQFWYNILINNYNSSESLNLTFEMRFKYLGSKNSNQKFKGIVQKNADAFYSSLLGRITIRDEKYNLFIDESLRTITVFNDQQVVENGHVLPQDLISNSEMVINKKYESESEIVIELNARHSLCKMDLTINKGTGFMDKYVCKYSGMSGHGLESIEIVYDNKDMKINPNLSPNLSEVYIRKDQGKFQGKGNYRQFKVINEYQVKK